MASGMLGLVFFFFNGFWGLYRGGLWGFGFWRFARLVWPLSEDALI